MNFKLAIFDLDGTLADTIYSIRDAVNLTLDIYSMPHKNYEEIRKAIGNGARELIRLCLPEDRRADESFVTRVLEDYNKMYALTYDKLDGCYDGMFDAVHALCKRGVTVAVLSNKQEAYVKKIISLLFPSGEVKIAMGQTALPRKPDAYVPLMIAKAVGVKPEECVFIGDSEVDVQTGKNAGMATVGCTWGYRARNALTEADYIVDDADGLLSVFGKEE